MPKSEVSRGAHRKRRPADGRHCAGALEGQVEEICRDLSVQVKRMRQLREQADELRTALREWAYQAERIPFENRLIVQDDAEGRGVDLQAAVMSVDPRSLNLFMNKLTRDRVVPIISVSVS